MLIDFAHSRGRQQIPSLLPSSVIDGRDANDGIAFLEFIRSPQQLFVQRGFIYQFV